MAVPSSANGAVTITIGLQETAADLNPPEVELARAVCQVLIHSLPQRAFPELFRALVEIYQFYSTAPTTRRLPAATRRVAKRGARRVREEIVIDED